MSSIKKIVKKSSAKFFIISEAINPKIVKKSSVSKVINPKIVKKSSSKLPKISEAILEDYESSPLFLLPQEIQSEIYGYLNPSDYGSLSRSNRSARLSPLIQSQRLRDLNARDIAKFIIELRQLPDDVWNQIVDKGLLDTIDPYLLGRYISKVKVPKISYVYINDLLDPDSKIYFNHLYNVGYHSTAIEDLLSKYRDIHLNLDGEVLNIVRVGAEDELLEALLKKHKIKKYGNNYFTTKIGKFISDLGSRLSIFGLDKFTPIEYLHLLLFLNRLIEAFPYSGLRYYRSTIERILFNSYNIIIPNEYNLAQMEEAIDKYIINYLNR